MQISLVSRPHQAHKERVGDQAHYVYITCPYLLGLVKFLSSEKFQQYSSVYLEIPSPRNAATIQLLIPLNATHEILANGKTLT